MDNAITILEHETKLSPSLEDSVREDLKHTSEELANLRRERRDIDAVVKKLVAQEKTLKRLVAVYDRVAAGPKPRGPRKAKAA